MIFTDAIVSVQGDDTFVSGGIVAAPASPELASAMSASTPHSDAVARAFAASRGGDPSTAGPAEPGFLYTFPHLAVTHVCDHCGPGVSRLLTDVSSISDVLAKATGIAPGPGDLASPYEISEARTRYAVGFMLATARAATAGALTAGALTAGALTADALTAGALTAGALTAGAVTTGEVVGAAGSSSDATRVSGIIAADRAIVMPSDAVMGRSPIFMRVVLACGRDHVYSVRHMKQSGGLAAVDDAGSIVNASDLGVASDLAAEGGVHIAGVHAVRSDDAGGPGTAFSVRSVDGTVAMDTTFLTLDFADGSGLVAPVFTF